MYFSACELQVALLRHVSGMRQANARLSTGVLRCVATLLQRAAPVESLSSAGVCHAAAKQLWIARVFHIIELSSFGSVVPHVHAAFIADFECLQQRWCWLWLYVGHVLEG